MDYSIITRLRIGHSFITHSHLLNNSPPPICPHCNVSHSIEHIIISCPHFNCVRNSLSFNDNLLNLFLHNSSASIISYIKDCGFFNQIQFFNVCCFNQILSFCLYASNYFFSVYSFLFCFLLLPIFFSCLFYLFPFLIK